jgi:hypothetical protein
MGGPPPPFDDDGLARRPELIPAGLSFDHGRDGTCEPVDLVANRLDPPRGAWFHPYSVTVLWVLSVPQIIDVAETDDKFVVEVTFRLAVKLGVPVVAKFACL